MRTALVARASYLHFVIGRIAACLDQQAFPYERRVCIWESRVIFTCAALGTVVFALPLWLGWLLGVWPLAAELVFQSVGLPPAGTLAVLALLGAYLAHAGAWWGAFAWVDLGPGEWWRSVSFGAPYVPNIANETLEKFPGFKRGSYATAENDKLEAEWNRDKFLPLSRWQGDPGSKRYDVLPPEEQTWAVRFHHRHVRPRLIRRGVPGYEVRA